MDSTLSARIKECMAAVGVNNEQLAAACKVKAPTSFHWASGKTKKIKAEPLLLAAKLFGVTPDWLATGKGQKFIDGAQTPSVKEKTVQYLPEPKQDKLTSELIYLFGQLDHSGKQEYLVYLRGFVAGRSPHAHGPASKLAGQK